MNLTTRRPFDLMNELQRDMNRLFDSRLFPASASLAAGEAGNWTPAVDIHEDAEAYHVSVDLPGIDSKNIEVTADNGLLSIRGQREEVHEDKELKRSERIFGSFLREFSLPENADLERVEANSRNGVLEITVPKAARPEPKRIEVR